ncbi:hypothetical protein V2J09_007232 [Rumex salicifolius]
MGKKFFDKKKAATFQLFARDTSGPSQSDGPDTDHVFIRVDNNPVTIDGFDESHENDSNSDDSNSRFADAPEDEDFTVTTRPAWQSVEQSGPLPDHIRREILELGFPDDGYNYLTHMREIKKKGGGSMYYENPKPNLDQIPHDVKAYDASRVQVEGTNVEVNEKRIMYDVAAKTVNVRVQKAIDPDVIALLNDNNSHCGSDIEDLEEDFVVQANLPEEGADLSDEENCILADEFDEHIVDGFSSIHMSKTTDQTRDYAVERKNESIHAKSRPRRPLDEQFDMLELQEYGTDSDNDYGNFGDEEEEPLEKKLSSALKNHKIDELDLDDNYKTPADFLRDDSNQNQELSGSAAVVLQRCIEYGKKYENGDDDEREVVLEESSDEEEAWDCETIVSTYSNLDNHPGRIGAPENAWKKKLSQTTFESIKLNNNNNNFISLHGKEKLPLDYLPYGKSAPKEKTELAAKPDPPKRRQEESKAEKKERKSAVKKEKREARILKKETKELYRDETKRAQKAVSVSGPSSIRLM